MIEILLASDNGPFLSLNDHTDRGIVKTVFAGCAIIMTEKGKSLNGCLVFARFRQPFQQLFPEQAVLFRQIGTAVFRHGILLMNSSSHHIK